MRRRGIPIETVQLHLHRRSAGGLFRLDDGLRDGDRARAVGVYPSGGGAGRLGVAYLS